MAYFSARDFFLGIEICHSKNVGGILHCCYKGLRADAAQIPQVQSATIPVRLAFSSAMHCDSLLRESKFFWHTNKRQLDHTQSSQFKSQHETAHPRAKAPKNIHGLWSSSWTVIPQISCFFWLTNLNLATFGVGKPTFFLVIKTTLADLSPIQGHFHQTIWNLKAAHEMTADPVEFSGYFNFFLKNCSLWNSKFSNFLSLIWGITMAALFPQVSHDTT
jgi:hypothetical protein